ncbi:substrate-binding periplasmic protein [Leucobacter sp. GX24907]
MSSPWQHRIRPAVLVAATALILPLTACSSSDDSADAAEDCTPAHELETLTPGELTVASYDYPPLSVVDGDTYTGVEGDLLTEIAERECLTLTIESAGGASAAIPSVQSGRADIASGSWFRTDEREEIVRLSTPVFLASPAIVSFDELTSKDLKGKKVGSVAGNLWNEEFQNELGDDFTIYQDEESIYKDLEAGRIDAIAAAQASAVARFADHPLEGASVIVAEPNGYISSFERIGQIGWMTSYDNEALGTAIDEDIEALREEGVIAQKLEEYDLNPEDAEPGEPFNL